jgi:hypothetical protein
MAAHGQSVRTNCGSETRLGWKSTDVKGVNQAGVRDAVKVFLDAYKAKGYFPAQDDPAPTMAESLAFYAKINEYVPPAGARPAPTKFPLTTAPWPMMTFLAMDRQPLRVREDMWERYCATGEFHGYGEYVGNIAQNPPMLQARRTAPYEFNYNSIQMMLKDGGVCGTMANISVRNQMILGAPASTAGQPGHCALVSFKGGANGPFACVGGQYATAGDAGTGVHMPFVFDGGSRRKMYAHQSVAYAVNAGESSFLDTLAARSFFLSLSDDLRKGHGLDLLESALVENPYNLVVIEAAQGVATTPAQLARVGAAEAQGLKAVAGLPGCPQNGLMLSTIRGSLYDKLGRMPIPADKAEAGSILAFLKADACTVAKLNTDYYLAAEGPAAEKALIDGLLADFTTHLAGARTPDSCAAMAARIEALASSKCTAAAKAACLASLKTQIQGHEAYTYPVKKAGKKVNENGTDASAQTLSKL